MGVTPASFDAATTAYTVAWQKGLDSAPQTWTQIADLFPSTTKVEEYPFLGRLARMREWKGSRHLRKLQAYTYSLTNKKFEDSVEVPREDLEDDKIGLWSGVMQDLGAACGYLPQDRVVAALVAGGAALCYDGQYFFDTDHPVDPYNAGAGTQVNLYTSTALSEANFASVRAAMRVLKDENSNILRVNPDLLIVPAALELTARRILEGEYISVGSGSTQTNVLKGSAKLLVMPELDANSTTTWYVVDSSRPVKPFFYQQRIAPEFQSDTDPNSARVIEKDTFIYAARARGEAGYGLWQLAAKCTA